MFFLFSFPQSNKVISMHVYFDSGLKNKLKKLLIILINTSRQRLIFNKQPDIFF